MNERLEQYFQEKREQHLEEWKQFIRFPSISTDSAYKDGVRNCARFLARHLQEIGFEHVRQLETAGHPTVYADWLHAPGKPTVLVYGHYDVQPADPLELWQSPPFEPEIRDGMLYARGASDNKGQIFMHLKAFEALFATTGSLPVNVKLCIEGEEETGSANLPALVEENLDRFAADLLVVSDTAMLGPNQPAICYALRGLTALQIDVKGAESDLHSGSYGGAVPNAVHALVELLGTMRSKDGVITVEGFYDDVRPLGEEERESLRALPRNDETIARQAGVQELVGEPGYTALERTWARPTLEVNGIYGGYQGEGVKTVIPCEAHAKITCRLVPDQDPQQIFRLIAQHVERHTPPGVTVTVRSNDFANPFLTPFDHPALQLAQEAYQHGFGVPACFIRNGGSIPIVETFARLLGIPVALMGFALPTSNAHAPNEFFPLENFDKGLRTLCYYWIELPGVMKRE